VSVFGNRLETSIAGLLGKHSLALEEFNNRGLLGNWDSFECADALRLGEESRYRFSLFDHGVDFIYKPWNHHPAAFARGDIFSRHPI